jgi:hypothetical protein
MKCSGARVLIASLFLAAVKRLGYHRDDLGITRIWIGVGFLPPLIAA